VVREAVEAPGADRRPCADEKGRESDVHHDAYAEIPGTAREIETAIESIMKEAAK
jgi:hypothetical protein